ncbi:MAG: virulence-associated E family protein, partial [Paracoccaceae bacterium]|nr:virulence-associated E family protein [Paracoccaceae bacterium]
ENNPRARGHIYFAVNEVSTPGKKAAASEVGHVRGLYVDIDCGEDPEAQRPALASLTTDLPQGVPEPTALISSGGGFWAFWMFAEPILVDGDQDLIDNIEDALCRLQEVFAEVGADASCTDVSRIARLPYTVNFAADKSANRTDKLATVLSDDWQGKNARSRRYALTDFLKLPTATRNPKAQRKRATSAIGRACPPVTPKISWRDLGYEVERDGDPVRPDDLAAVIVSGPNARDLAEPDLRDRWLKPDGKTWDRSLAVFYVAAELDRRGIAPELIARVLLTEQWAISDHLYSHAPGNSGRAVFKRETYARRQVERAMDGNDKDRAEKLAAPEPPGAYDPDARGWMNQRFATVENYGGKYRVMARPGVDDPTLPMFLEDTQWARRFNGYLTGVMDRETGEMVPAPLSKVWLGDRDRARHSRVVFDPAGEDPDPRAYNLWTGFVTQNASTECEKYLALTREVIADGSEEVAEYLLNWMALRVQQPGLKMEVAIALRGGQGLGKSLWVELFGELFGPHFVAVSGAHGLASNFNKHLLQALLVFGDEMNAAGDRAMVSRLKTLVTQTHIQIEPKGVDAFSAPNRFALIVASNDDRVVQIDPDDRRWLALDVSARWKGDLDRFEKVVTGWRSGGREAFHRFLLDRDLGEFNHRRRPITATHTEQVRASFSGAMGIVHAILDRGETPPVGRSGAEQDCPTRSSGEVFVPTGDLLRWARAERLVTGSDGNVETALGRELATASPYARTLRASIYGRQVRGVWLAPLSEARRMWAAAHGLRLDWSEEAASWDVAPATGEIPPGEVPF